MDDSGLAYRAGFGALVIGATALPTLAFYTLGYNVRRGKLAGALWLAGTLPLAAYTGLALMIVVSYALCPVWSCDVFVD
jgi:hypothetical protein